MIAIMRSIANWTAVASGLCLLVLMLITFVDVVGRYLGSPLTFTVEAVRLGMGLIVFLGLALTTLEKGHITVDVVSSAAPERTRRLFSIIGSLCAVVFFALVAWQLWIRAASFRRDGLTTEVLLAPVYPAAYVMSLAAGFTVIICVWLLFRPDEGGE